MTAIALLRRLGVGDFMVSDSVLLLLDVFEVVKVVYIIDFWLEREVDISL